MQPVQAVLLATLTSTGGILKVTVTLCVVVSPALRNLTLSGENFTGP